MIDIKLFARVMRYGEMRKVRALEGYAGWYTDGVQLALLGDAGDAIVTGICVTPPARFIEDHAAIRNLCKEDLSLRREHVEGEYGEKKCASCNGSGQRTCGDCDCKCDCGCERCDETGTQETVIRETVQGRAVFVNSTGQRAVIDSRFAPMLRACDELHCTGDMEAVIGHVNGECVCMVMPLNDREINP